MNAGRGDHFADAALRVAGEQRPDVLAHPRSADLTRHAIRVLRRRELENQDQVRLVDLRDAGPECACSSREPYTLAQRLDGRVSYRIAQPKVIDDDVPAPTLSRQP